MSKISVIIPIYNGESYIERCVESVLNQTHRDLEILLIDDGSTDRTAQICDHYAAADPRIQVIHRANGGLSAARNSGIDCALQGPSTHLAFIDADDEMLPAMLEKLLCAMEQSGADISVCDFYQVRATGSDPRVSFRGNANKAEVVVKTVQGKEKFEQLIGNNLMTTVQWNKLYKKEIFRHIRYPEGKFHEDEFVIHRELAAADKVTFIPDKLYRYYRHEDSITGTPAPEKYYHALEAYIERMEFFLQQDNTEMAGKTYHFFKVYARINYKKDIQTEKTDRRMREMDELYRRYYTGLPLSEKIKAMAFTIKYTLYCRFKS